MKYLHIMHNEKFNKAYIDFINKNFNSREHLFLFLGGSKTIKIPNYQNVIVGSNKGGLERKINWNSLLFRHGYKSEKIFLHGLWNDKVINFLFINSFLLKKCNWIIWGGDLYAYQTPKLTFKSRFHEFMRAFCIKRFGGLITQIKGDYELAQKWYGAQGKYYYSFGYPSNLYKEFDISRIKKDKNKIYIQVGNSSDPSNNHIEILDKLKQYKDENIEIICPISYGDKVHSQKVKEYGEEIFDNKFIALTEFLSFDKYLEILGKIDIAIFNHKRQQGVGNILTLLGLGKKVYIRSDVTTWSFLNDLGIKVYDYEGKVSLEKQSLKDGNSNRTIIKNEFSECKLKEDWKSIFDQS